MAKFISNYVMSMLNFGSFHGKILFTAGYSYDEICKELKKQKCLEWLQAFENTHSLWSDTCSGFSSLTTVTINGKDYQYCFVCLRDRFDFSDRAHSILSHEVIHICTHNLSQMFDIVKENEAFAYTHTHILDQCYNILRNKK